ncbi:MULTISPECIES: nitrilase-related carbon-nitrogen hydrolase [Gordonibacter]|uniref:Nitrilase-related carbon-nitrogen hydrolase n=1 Tax=Gordonibacter faecis TaxID=3047475 RepID=A0ABT7DSA4_9ACTN|nr:nitrilase-related carbon-nitrogen hydrolase [Gordonibacter sp. KGMB12511]MDJ1651483.1 nitrilase-related carbon-nitrogen hydrolase [Gordonibacter sp. KGMB12511]
MNTKQTAHLALVQFESVLCDPAANTEKACRMIAEAAAEGADLVVLPELFSTGYELNIVGPHIPELAEPVDGPTVRALQEAARAAGCYVVAGVPLTYELEGVVFNSAVVIDRAGEVMGTYDKQHLWALERFYFRSGAGLPVFDTDFGRVGVLICYDLGFPEVARMLALQGADILVCPSAWCAEDMDVWDINVPARALENTVFLAAVNRYGVEDDLVMPGHTKVCNPRGQVVAELEEEAEGVLHVEIDVSDIKDWRQKSPYLRDRRPDLYDYVLLP